MVIRPAHPAEGERLREITAAAKGVLGLRARARAAPGRRRSTSRRTGWRARTRSSPRRADERSDGPRSCRPAQGVCVLEHLWVDAGADSPRRRDAALPPRSRPRARPGRDRHGVGGRAERARVLRADGWPAGAHGHVRVGARALGHGRVAPAVIQATSRTPLARRRCRRRAALEGRAATTQGGVRCEAGSAPSS